MFWLLTFLLFVLLLSWFVMFNVLMLVTFYHDSPLRNYFEFKIERKYVYVNNLIDFVKDSKI